MGTFVLFVSGFRQNERRRNGISDAFMGAIRLRRRLAPDSLRASLSRIEYRLWDDDPAATADHVVRTMGYNNVALVAYSWGAGWFGRRFVRELCARHCGVSRSIWLDPVYRSPVFPSAIKLNPLSLLRGKLAPRVPLSPNVVRAALIRQASDPLLRGHDLKAGSRTEVRRLPVVSARHSEMDESQEFSDELAYMLSRIFGVAPGLCYTEDPLNGLMPTPGTL